MAKKKANFIGLQILLVLGMLASLFLVYEHFSPSASKFCTFGSAFDCGIVNKSPYATVDGLTYLFAVDFGWNVPVLDIGHSGWLAQLLVSNAFLGFLTLLFLFLLLKAYQKNKNFLWIHKGKELLWMKCILIFGVLYGFYLFLIQHFILKTYCIFCLTLDAVLVLSLILVWRSYHEQ